MLLETLSSEHKAPATAFCEYFWYLETAGKVHTPPEKYLATLPYFRTTSILFQDPSTLWTDAMRWQIAALFKQYPQGGKYYLQRFVTRHPD